MSANSTSQSMAALPGAALRVAYDALALVSGDGGTGKGMQLRNLIDSRWAQFQGYAPPVGKQKRIAAIVQGGNRRYLIWQQASLPRMLKPWKPDVFLAPYNTAPLWLPRHTRLVLVLHDLILLQSFGPTTPRARIVNSYRRRLIPLSVARSSYVLTVSEFSRNRILEKFPEARVIVIPCTIPESWFVGPGIRQQRDNYILLVTAPPPHKNTARALRAYARYVSMAGAGAANLRIVGLAGAGESFPAIVRAASAKPKSNLRTIRFDRYPPVALPPCQSNSGPIADGRFWHSSARGHGVGNAGDRLARQFPFGSRWGSGSLF